MSVELKNLKAEILKDALMKGWYQPQQVQGYINDLLTPERIQRWFNQVYKPVGGFFLPRDRFVNHFSLGADPEMVLLNQGVRQDAQLLGLKAGLAFGADNNGRLVELRPIPSRSALEVVTSTWLSMYWMTKFHPETAELSWRSGAYIDQDGLGGHIHFGRKNERLREREVRALDRLTHLLFTAGIFDRNEGRLRFHQARGAHGMQYGSQGDIRKQPHGWEYRTLPSWLDSPWMSYFLLTTGKLSVWAAEMLPVLAPTDAQLTADQARGYLRFLLAYFRGADDDARLALSILQRHGFPQHVRGLDFKLNWGLLQSGFQTPRAKLPVIQPCQVPATASHMEELALAMYEGRAPDLDNPEPTWQPSSLPEGYYQVIQKVASTHLAPGLGEFTADLCCHEDYPLAFRGGNGSADIQLPPDLYGVLTKAKINGLINKLGATINYGDRKDIAIQGNNLIRLMQLRELLLEHNVFPMWDISKVTSSSYSEWKAKGSKKDRHSVLLNQEPKKKVDGPRGLAPAGQGNLGQGPDLDRLEQLLNRQRPWDLGPEVRRPSNGDMRQRTLLTGEIIQEVYEDGEWFPL